MTDVLCVYACVCLSGQGHPFMHEQYVCKCLFVALIQMTCMQYKTCSFGIWRINATFFYLRLLWVTVTFPRSHKGAVLSDELKESRLQH